MSDSDSKPASGLDLRVEAEVARLKGLYKSLEPVSGLERDYMMRLKRQWELIEDLHSALQDALADNLVLATGKADLFLKVQNLATAVADGNFNQANIIADARRLLECSDKYLNR